MSDIGIITALPVEAKSLTKQKINPGEPVKIQEHVWLCVTGMGADNANSGVDQFNRLGIRMIVNWGVAGALDENYRSGDIIIPSVITNGIDDIVTNPDWHQSACVRLTQKKISHHTEKLLSTDHIINTTHQKQELANKTGSKSVDMEGFVLASAAKKLNLDLLIIKSIADELDTHLPDCVIKYTDQYGQPEFIQFLMEIICHPQQLKALIHLARCFKKAEKSLRMINNQLINGHFFHPHFMTT